MLTYSLRYRINIAGAVGTWTAAPIGDCIEMDGNVPNISLEVAHQNYQDMLRQGTSKFGVYGVLAKICCEYLLPISTTATENSIDIEITESGACGDNVMHVFSVTAANFSYCQSASGGCDYSVDARYNEPRLFEIRETLITQQYPAAQGCYFEPNNFTVNVVWLPYINLDNNKVDGNIAGVFIRQLIENAVNFISNAQGYPITYNGTTDLYFADTNSVYHDAVITNFVVGGVDFVPSANPDPNAHQGEVLLNQPLWSLRTLLDNLAVHYNITWRLIDNNGTFELHIRERDTWNASPLFNVGNLLTQYDGEICSDGETEGVYETIEINQKTLNSETAGNKPRLYYSEFERFLQNQNNHQTEKLTIEDPFSGCTINGDLTRLGHEFFRRDVLGDWWITLAPVRPSGGFIVVNADTEEDPNSPRIIVPDPQGMASNYDPASGTYVDVVAEYRPATAAEQALLIEYGYYYVTFSGFNLRNWHEWVDSGINALLVGAGDSNRWEQFKKYDPINNTYLGRVAEITLCYSCSVMQLLGMYAGDTPKIDYLVTGVEQHFNLPITSYNAYIESISVTVGKEIKIKIRY